MSATDVTGQDDVVEHGPNGGHAEPPGELQAGAGAGDAQSTGAHAGRARRIEREVSVPTPEHDHELAEFIPYALLFTDTGGVIRDANSAARDLFGRPLHYLLGKPLPVLVDLDQRRSFRTEMNHVGVSASRIDHWAVRFRKDGGSFDATVSVAAVYGHLGRVEGLRWLIRQPDNFSYVAEGDRGIVFPRRTHTLSDNAALRARFMADASELLMSSFDSERTLAGVAQLAVPLLADWCILDLVEETNRVRRLHVAYSLASEQSLAERLGRFMPYVPGDGSLFARVLRSRQGEVVTVSDPREAFLVGDLAHWRLLGEIGVKSCMIVPLVVRGRSIGLLTLMNSRSKRRFTSTDFELACDVARLASIAADNAYLYQEAQRANEAKSNFLAAMSHELRTPLTAIVGYSEILADAIVGPVTDVQREHLERIRTSAEHLRSIVEEILGFARLEAGQEHVHVDDVTVGDLSRVALQLVEPQASKKHLDLRLTLPDNDLVMRTDVGKLRQILVNLLGNAVKFTDAGGVELIVVEDGADVVFVVADTGIGMTPQQLDHIFEPFWQADQGKTRSYQGTGLGLGVVRHLAQLLGGGVAVTSEPGKGSRFEVRLPLFRTFPRADETGASAPSPPQPSSGLAEETAFSNRNPHAQAPTNRPA